jgi:protein-S-isoprenylcysteine O-methyltransferase Ste14
VYFTNASATCFAVGGRLKDPDSAAFSQNADPAVNPTKPELSSSLVTWGVYAITRNPMYLGGLIMLTGWAIFLSNALVFLFLPAYVLYINLSVANSPNHAAIGV